MDNNSNLNENNLDQNLDIRAQAGKKVKEAVREMSGVNNKGKKRLLNNTISFMSSSGGAGASTLVASIGHELAKQGYSVAVIDLNVMYPSQNKFFDIPYSTEKNDLIGCISGEYNIGQCLKYYKGIGVLVSMNRSIIDYVSCDNGDASANLDEILNRIAYLFDVVLIDCPNLLHFDLVNTALYRSDTIYLVMDDGAQSLLNIPKVIANFEVTGIHTKKVKYILNKRTSFYYPESNLNQFEIKLSGIIPFEMGVLECSLDGKMFITQGESTSKSSKDYVRGMKALVKTVLVEGGARDI